MAGTVRPPVPLPVILAATNGDESALAEEYARKKGYVMPDERVYVDITPGEEE